MAANGASENVVLARKSAKHRRGGGGGVPAAQTTRRLRSIGASAHRVRTHIIASRLRTCRLS